MNRACAISELPVVRRLLHREALRVSGPSFGGGCLSCVGRALPGVGGAFPVSQSPFCHFPIGSISRRTAHAAMKHAVNSRVGRRSNPVKMSRNH